jgi:hypothetical protein
MRVINRVLNLLIFLSAPLVMSGCLPGEESGAANGVAINFTNPSGASSIETSDIVVNIAGTVTSAAEVELVQWQNDRGGMGNANGKANFMTGNIVLKPGTNNIEITATTVDGASTSEILTVEREIAKVGDPEPADTNEPVVTTVTWVAPSSRDDNSPLTNLAGFYVYYGQRSGEYVSKVPITNPNASSHTVSDLAPGTWFFAVSAYDDNGFESNLSSEISRTL